MTAPASHLPLRACHCCGLVHRIGVVPPRHNAVCTRCASVIRHGTHPRALSRTGAFAAAALVLYPAALLLPVMTIQRLGHEQATSIWGGMVGLLAEGHWAVGAAVLTFSIIAPVLKLGALAALCLGRRAMGRDRRAATYRLVEFVGRWGMVDVLLVALVVAAVKLGDLVEVTPGPGVVAFGAVVVLSMLASVSFDPHAIWEDA